MAHRDWHRQVAEPSRIETACIAAVKQAGHANRQQTPHSSPRRNCQAPATTAGMSGGRQHAAGNRSGLFESAPEMPKRDFNRPPRRPPLRAMVRPGDSPPRSRSKVLLRFGPVTGEVSIADDPGEDGMRVPAQSTMRGERGLAEATRCTTKERRLAPCYDPKSSSSTIVRFLRSTKAKPPPASRIRTSVASRWPPPAAGEFPRQRRDDFRIGKSLCKLHHAAQAVPWRLAAMRLRSSACRQKKKPRDGGAFRGGRGDQSQLSAPPVWYSMTRVSKKLRSFFRSIISLIHGNGFSSWSNSASRPIWVARRLAMKRR